MQQKRGAVDDPEIRSVAVQLLFQQRRVRFYFFGFHRGRRSRGFCAAPSLGSAAQAGGGSEGCSSSSVSALFETASPSEERTRGRGAGSCESLEEDLVLSLSLSTLSSSTLTDDTSLRVSNLRRGIAALDEWRPGCRNRERLEG